MEKISIDKLIKADWNYKTDNPKLLKKLVANIKKNGQIENLIVREMDDGLYEIVNGNHRLDALQKLEIAEAWCYSFGQISDNQAKRIAIETNETKFDSDIDKLEGLLLEINNDFTIEDLAETMPYETDDIDKMLEDITMKNTGEERQSIEDDVPEMPECLAIQEGDIIELGKHRVMCGDSTKEENVNKLMDGKKADIVFTDPPYGIDVVSNNQIGGRGPVGGIKNYKGTIGGNNIVKANKYKPIEGDQSTDVCRKFYKVINNYDNIILWGGNHFTDFLPVSRGWICWDKIDGLEGTTKNFSDIELAWTSFDVPARIVRHRWQGLMKGSERNEKRCHPTQKPIELAKECFELFNAGLNIFDGFLGSGSTLIACEKTNRICMGMEIDRHYCSVIIQRYCDYTDNHNIKINGKDVDWREYKKESVDD